jgi:hypothetical protein
MSVLKYYMTKWAHLSTRISIYDQMFMPKCGWTWLNAWSVWIENTCFFWVQTSIYVHESAIAAIKIGVLFSGKNQAFNHVHPHVCRIMWHLEACRGSPSLPWVISKVLESAFRRGDLASQCKRNASRHHTTMRKIKLVVNKSQNLTFPRKIKNRWIWHIWKDNY